MSDLVGQVPECLSTCIRGPIRSMRRHRILHEVCLEFDITLPDLMSSCKARTLVTARHCAYWLIRRLGYSFSQIGKFMDRDHSSIMYGVVRAQTHYADHLSAIMRRIEEWDTNNDQ